MKREVDSFYVLENNNYNTITIEFIYPVKYDSSHMFDNSIFMQIVMNSSYKYKNEQEFKLEKIKRLIISCSVNEMVLHNNLYIKFSLTVPSPDKIKDFNLDNAFEFFYDMIYSPNVSNGMFDETQFEREKNYIASDINSSLKNKRVSSYQKFICCVDDAGDLKNNKLNNIDLIYKSNPKDLYGYYKNIIIDNTPICIFYGDISYLSAKKIYNRYFNIKKITIDEDYDCYMKLSKTPNYIEESFDYNQSILYTCYKVLDMDVNDKRNLKLLLDILGSNSTNLILKKLRDEKKLIYSYNLSGSKKGMFYIETYINKSNKENVLASINEIMDVIKDEKIIKESVDRIIKKLEYDIVELKDSKYYLLDKFIYNLLDIDESKEEMYEYYKNLDIKQFEKFLSRVKLDTVYFFRGEKNEGK